ncbi:hypothetical protein COCSADRAFT_313577 [Bipolaris sorokiniana ND90Pr]|uniref:Uncharacterized protein n=1 Tax=Cochliobolus sativus (strain ND90Pr / ATCC 201652) TaxID=665912 RepID=M2RD18_COCSN|nr:uncharacterized protein COCSADRAFT_313577 [Bipolaris sorokiniana ND90Pr]EMD64699.1 hypothetical protein COCSADRAFT_313577 [Bipolaris sorokiniana ND90Pr]
MLSRGRRVLLACLLDVGGGRRTSGGSGGRKRVSAVASTAHHSFLVLDSQCSSFPILSSTSFAPLSFAFLHRFPCASLLQPKTTYRSIVYLQSRHYGTVASSSLTSHVSILHKTTRVAPTLAGSFHAYI